MELIRIAQDSARGGYFLIVGASLSTVIGSIVVMLIARLLGPEGYGLYTLCFVLPAIFAAVTDFGISPALTRYGASLRVEGKYSKLASMISSGVLFNLVVGAVATILVFVFSNELAWFVLRRQGIGQLVAMASITIVFQCLFNLSHSAFVGLDRMEWGALSLVVRDTTRLVMSPLLILLGFGVTGAISGQLIGWVLASFLAVLLLIHIRKTVKEIPNRIGMVDGLQLDLRVMLRYGLPLYVASLVTVVLTQYQNIMLAFFASNIEIGNFTAAVNFGSLVTAVSIPITTTLFPAFSKLDLETARDDLKKMLVSSVRYTSLVILPVAVAVAALSKPLTQAVYGNAYTLAATYLVLYACLFLLGGIGYQVLPNFFNGIGRTKDTLSIILVQFTIFIVSAPIMTWLYHVPGLIVALVLSTFVQTIYGLLLASRKYGMCPDFKALGLVFAAALASALPILPLVYFSPFSSLVTALLGAAIYSVSYLTLLPIFKAIKQTDLEIIGSALSRIRIINSAISMIVAYESWLLSQS